MRNFNVKGMSCAACAANIERAVKKVNGVDSCAVSLLTNSMTVEGTAATSDIIKAVKKAGYSASVKGERESTSSEGSSTITSLIERLVASSIITIALMYFSMGVSMWSWPAPQAIKESPVILGLIEMVLTTLVMVINQRFFISGLKGLIHRSPNMDSLVAIGAGASYCYSLYALFAAAYYTDIGRVMAAKHMVHSFYFEGAAMILTLITVGKTLEAISKGKTTNAIQALTKLAPDKATILEDGRERVIKREELEKGMTFVIRQGESIPADGIVLSGSASVDESALTGESIPSEKSEGSRVYEATINTSGYLVCRAESVKGETVLSKIIDLVSQASSSKAPIAKIADRVSSIFVPSVITIAVIALCGWLIAGRTFGYALTKAISVLVISCPCALGLATPVAIMVGSGKGARRGILFKNAESLERSGKVTICALDKTGTITTGKPEVVTIKAYSEAEYELLRLAYSLEKKSEHPLSLAICKRAEEARLEAIETNSFKAIAGGGLESKCQGAILRGGNLAYIKKYVNIPREAEEFAANKAECGETPLFFAKDECFIGIITVRDMIRQESKRAIAELRNMGIKTIMLTGDNEKTAKAIAKESGVDEFYASLLPSDKEKVVASLMKNERVMMVGDGINDAPSLTRADIGVAIGSGTDIAIDAADVVIMKSSLLSLAEAIRLSRRTLVNIKENLFWAFGYNAIGIPLAAGILFGLKLSPMFAALSMSISSVLVVTNALRLNLFDITSSKGDRKIKRKQIHKENSNMTKTLKIEGLMCSHCEATVRKTLEALDGVKSAEVSHERGEAVVTLSKALSDEILKEAVERKDYKVTEIK